MYVENLMQKVRRLIISVVNYLLNDQCKKVRN